MSKYRIAVGAFLTRKLKARIWRRDHGGEVMAKCHWCPKLLSFAESTLDHEPPMAEGGTWEQAVIACDECNQERARLQQKRKVRRAYRARRRLRKEAQGR